MSKDHQTERESGAMQRPAITGQFGLWHESACWNRVEDSLPPEYVTCLVCRPGAPVITGFRFNGSAWGSDVIEPYANGSVTHWMPLPPAAQLPEFPPTASGNVANSRSDQQTAVVGTQAEEARTILLMADLLEQWCNDYVDSVEGGEEADLIRASRETLADFWKGKHG